MAGRDYSATPLSQKLGAKPGAGVVVFFTTSREDLDRHVIADMRGSGHAVARFGKIPGQHWDSTE